MRPTRFLSTLAILCGLLILNAHPAFSQDADQLIAQGDEFAEKKFDNKSALEAYEKAAALRPNDYNILWRISRAYVDIGEHLPDQTDALKDAQLKVYEQSLGYANQAISANPKGTMGYLRRAIVNGRIALIKGVISVIGLVKEVRRDLEKAIELNNGGTHQLAVAHYVLGRTHAKVCEKPYLLRLPLGLGWGDRDVAAAEFEKAVSLNPDFIMFRLDAARNYVEMDEYQKAKQHLYKIPSLQKGDEDDDRFRKEAAALLETIKNK
jgi:tetratricopeptide (TPR) repeat protein